MHECRWTLGSTRLEGEVPTQPPQLCEEACRSAPTTRLASKAARGLAKHRAQPGYPLRDTMPLEKPRRARAHDAPTHTNSGVCEEPAARILRQMAAPRAARLLAGWAVPCGPVRCCQDDRGPGVGSLGPGGAVSEESSASQAGAGPMGYWVYHNPQSSLRKVGSRNSD